MSDLCGQTQNFYWGKSLTCFLGKGTCGVVYKGRNKNTGEHVAVKTLTETGMSRSAQVQARELEVIKRINHTNIIKLIAVEEEEEEGRSLHKMVIVMELCAGGSLAKILEDPENSLGLDEDEFLLVLEHLTSGMKYLRENGIVHRDLKPGNIMQYICEDGTSIYKLGDFDAARELDEGQEFMSLYGTEEYLHPDMYEQALLTPIGQQTKHFGESVDLWSIGVTLYHVATGGLPFRPFLKKDRRTMHHITTQKQTGVISGHQLESEGKIRWSKKLPKECLLSVGLKTLITPMLAGLMEVNKQFRWDFATFFAETKTILEKKRLHVFYLNHVSSLRVYLSPGKSYQELQTLLQEQTGVSSENQTLLYKDSTLVSLIGGESGLGIPSTSQLIPILLCDKTNNNIEVGLTFPKHPFKTFPNTANRFTDEQIANYNCCLAYTYKRRIETICQNINLINSAVITINQVVVSQLMGVSKENLQIQSVVRSLSNQFEMMKGFQQSCQSFLTCIPLSRRSSRAFEPIPATVNSMVETYEQHLENFLKLGDRLMKLKPSICQLLGNRIEHRSLMLEWEQRSLNTNAPPNIARIESTATNIINKLKTSYETLRVKQIESIPSTKAAQESQRVLHMTERLVMMEKVESLVYLLRNEYQMFTKLTGDFSDWFKTAQIALVQPEILTEVMTQLRVDLSTCELNLNMVVKEFQEKLNKFTEALQKIQTSAELHSAAKEDSNHKTRKDSKSIVKLNNGIKEQLQIQEELLQQFSINLDICHQFQTLLADAEAEKTS